MECRRARASSSISAGLSAASRSPGHPGRGRLLFLDGLEKLTLGSALVEAVVPSGARDTPFPTATEQDHPALMAAVRSNDFDSEQLFVEEIRTFLAGVARR